MSDHNPNNSQEIDIRHGDAKLDGTLDVAIDEENEQPIHTTSQTNASQASSIDPMPELDPNWYSMLDLIELTCHNLNALKSGSRTMRKQTILDLANYYRSIPDIARGVNPDIVRPKSAQLLDLITELESTSANYRHVPSKVPVTSTPRANASQGRDVMAMGRSPIDMARNSYAPANQPIINESTSERNALKTIESFTFSGKVHDWPAWARTIKTNVLPMVTITPQEKQLMILKLLPSEAKIIFDGPVSTKQQLETNFKRLEDRYGSYRSLPEQYLKELHNLRSVKKDFDFTGLLKLKESVENVMHLLEPETREMKLQPVYLKSILDALPPSLAMDVMKEQTTTLPGIIQCIRKTLDNLYQMRLVDAAAKPTATVNVAAAQMDICEEEGCLFCGGGHSPMLCRKFQSTCERQKRLREMDRCLRCAERGHWSRECRSQSICSICFQYHAHWLCVLRDKTQAKRVHEDVSPASSQSPVAKRRDRSPRRNAKERVVHKTSKYSTSSRNDVRDKEQTRSDEHKDASSKRDQPVRQENAADNRNHRGRGRPPKSNKANVSCILNEDSDFETNALIPTLFVYLEHAERKLKARAVMDMCSHRNFISSHVMQRLILPSEAAVNLTVNGFGGATTTATFPIVNVVINNVQSSTQIKIKCLVKDIITANIEGFIDNELFDKLNAKGIYVDDCRSLEEARQCPIDLLIGAADLVRLTTGKTAWIDDHVVAVRTLVGWYVCGSTREQENKYSCLTIGIEALVEFERNDQAIENSILEQFTLINRIEGNDEPSDKESIRLTIQAIVQDMEMIDGRYYIGLPWLKRIRLDNNKATALVRIRRLKEKLIKANKYDEYKEALFTFVKEENAERIVNDQSYNSYYMPHRAVFKEHSTTKLRVVFDASSHRRHQDPLNAVLSKGLNLNPSIFDLLIKFRLRRVGVIADFKKAFLQIRIKERDRNYLKFLWINEKEEIETYRFTSLPFGATCSPHLLAVVVREHLLRHESDYPSTKDLGQSIYVDDIVTTVNTVEAAQLLKEEANELFAKCGMKLHKWRFSRSTPGDEDEETSVLGVTWNSQADTVQPRIQLKMDEDPWTFRKVLSLVGQMFDPMGLVSPAVIPLKLLAQEIQQRYGRLNERCDEPESCRLDELVAKFKRINEFVVKRRTAVSSKQAALIVCCDASSQALGAVAYVLDLKTMKWELLCSKAKVVARQDIKARRSVPELELQAAVIGARLFEQICSITGITRGVLFTDSRITLDRLRKSPNDMTVYVKNRVQTILHLTKVEQWRHIDTERNPADILSRGCTVDQLLKQTGWASMWKKGSITFESLTVNDLLDNRKAETVLITSTSKVDYDKRTWSELYEEKKREIELRKQFEGDKDPLIELTKEMQSKLLREKRLIKSNRDIPKDSRLHGLVVSVGQDDLLRVTTRMIEDKNGGEQGVPRKLIVIDGTHEYALSWLMWNHELEGHKAIKPLMDMVKEHHFVLKLRSLARKVLSRCEKCKRAAAKAGKLPMGNLPSFRTERCNPFTNIGIDFFGPIMNNMKRKRYGLLITCAVTRAVHVEVVKSIDTEAVFHGLRRAFARRGRPAIIYSDNGRSFVKADKDLQTLHRSVEFLSKKSKDFAPIKWMFTSPSAPWQGGFYERMVGTVKRAFKNLADKPKLTDDELVSMMAEAEAMVNSRPIATCDDGSPLTPADFIAGRALTLFPAYTDQQLGKLSGIKSAYACRMRLLNALWRNFRRGYLANLRERMQRVVKERPIKEGDQVLIADDLTIRDEWPIGEVVEEIPSGNSNKVRNFKLRIGDKLFIRPIQRLYLLEGDLLL